MIERDTVVTQNWEPETPFLESTEHAVRRDGEENVATAVETPFLTEYRMGDEVVSAEATSFRELLDELLDTEFDQSLEDLVSEASAEVERTGLSETSEPGRAERALERWVEPLRTHAEAMFDGLAESFENEDPRSLSEDRIDEIFSSFEPRETGMTPAFENFFGSLWKKAKAIAKKAYTFVNKLNPINAVLDKLKGLVRPLLDRVLKIALDKLPPSLRPIAARLAKRFLGEEEQLDETNRASTDIRAIQRGFNAEAATLLLMPAGLEQEELVSDAGAAADREVSTALTEYHEARERFIAQLQDLEEGEDPAPVVEEFIPAILAALRLGIRLIGRPRVVDFLAGYVANLISSYVGKDAAAALSKSIVDTGLRMISLEAEEDGGPRVAAEAFGNVVEDVVRKVSELSSEELDEEGTLEAVTHEAAQEAIASNFPSAVLSPTNDHLESTRVNGTWVAMPRGRRPRYRKYTRVIPVTITPTAARYVRTFGGRTLAQFLRDHLGQTGPVKARLHLYQAIPGTRLSAIARSERSVAGLGTGQRSARAQLHPLTREAAAALTGEPGLGRELDEDRLDEETPAVGDRLYYLEVPGVRPIARSSSGTTFVIDTRKNELRVAIFLSESDAQLIAARMRRREPVTAIIAALRNVYQVAIRSALSRQRRAIRVVGEAPETEQLFGGLRLGKAPMRIVSSLIERWVGKALVAQLLRHRQAFVAATAAKEDGVTLLVRIQAPPGLSVIAKLLRGGTKGILGALDPIAGIRSAIGSGGLVNAVVEIRAGRFGA